MNARKITRTFCVALMGVIFVAPAFGQFAEDALRFSQLGLGVGARALGMGNATVGFVSDYSALFWNPAGLASIRSYEFSVGLAGHNYGNDVSFFGVNNKATNTSTNLNNLGFVYPVPTRRGSLTFGFGYGRVNDFTGNASFEGFNSTSTIIQSMTPGRNLSNMTQNEQDEFLANNIPYQLWLANIDTVQGTLVPVVTGNVQQIVSVTEGGGLNHWVFGGALDLAKELSVGASFNIVSGSYSYDRQYTESDIRDIYVDNSAEPVYDFARFDFESTIKSDISGYNALFGLMYRKQGVMKFGLAVRTPTVYEIEESFSDEGRSYFDNGDQPDPIRFSNSTKYKITTPIVFSGGASFQIGEWLVLAGDAEYTDWTQMEFNTENLDLVEENRVIRRVFRPTTNLRGGVEMTIWELGLKLRGGIVWNPSPFKADADDRNFDQLYYTAGIGLMVDESTTLNAAYALGTWKTFRDNYYLSGIPNPSRTSERINTNNVNVTLSYRF
ncbi:MAG: hypothetical protein HYY49_13640 [Ignavibacteriales bacterium]|nr:hypothetical protein [Ignavibacteriales bacterium]